MRSSTALIALALLATGTAHAEWQGKAEAGVVFARGNTDTDSVNLKLTTSHEGERWKHALDMAALRAATSDVVTAKRYQAGWQSNYKWSPRAFWFGGLRYENDDFSGFDYQGSVTTGVGYKFIDSGRAQLSGQIGVGYRRLKHTLTQLIDNDAIYTLGADYEHQFTMSTKLVDKLRIDGGNDNTLIGNFTGIEVKMTSSLSLAVGLDVRHNTRPPDGLKKTDTLTTTNLVYSF